MAVRIVRQPKLIVLLGAPTSAAAMTAGHEKAPQALRAAGLVARLESLGFTVNDMGDDAVQLCQPDEESPRARNLTRAVAALEALKPRVEAAVKTGGLPLILTGDCTSALAMVAGVRRYYRGASIIYMDRDADMNIPATSPSGCVDGMVVSHLTGRGAAEMVRFWSEPPLVRDPEVAIFGVDRLDAPEEEVLSHSPIRLFRAADIQHKGAKASAESAVERAHSNRNELVVHLDVDVISGEDFQATELAAPGGLRLREVREALGIFLRQPRLAAVEIAGYNPDRDLDGKGAQTIIELIASALQTRLRAQEEAAQTDSAAAAAPSSAATARPAEAPSTETPSAPDADSQSSNAAESEVAPSTND